jgi:hypothetical protein
MPAIHEITAITCSALIHSYIRHASLVCQRAIVLAGNPDLQGNGDISASMPFLKQ